MVVKTVAPAPWIKLLKEEARIWCYCILIEKRGDSMPYFQQHNLEQHSVGSAGGVLCSSQPKIGVPMMSLIK